MPPFVRTAVHAAASALLCLPAVAADPNSSSASFRSLVDEAWEFEVREDPLLASQVGDRRYDDRLPDVAVADWLRRLETKKDFLRRLATMDVSALPAADQVNYHIFNRLLEDAIAELEYETYLTPVTNRTGFHVEFPELRRRMPLDVTEDYENYISRLRQFDRYAQQHLELLRTGIDRGIVVPSVVLSGYGDTIEAQLVDDPAQSLLYEPFAEFPERVNDADRTRLRAAGREAISEHVVRGYRVLLEFLRTTYVPATRGSVGASALPRGRAFYRHRVRKFTTLDMTPAEVHELGKAEVRRIRAEMRQVMRASGYDGDFSSFVGMLRTESRFYAATADELMKEVAIVLKTMDGKLPLLFRTLPRTPYGIRRVPEYVAPYTTTAYYMPAAGDGSRAGFYYVNTYDLKSRPLYEIEALSLHEAVPGHHLQLALQQELDGLPMFRRFAGFTAFVEGWGLYAERLGLETGFYKDPYRNFGRLSYEVWRACRLVVDTGIHYFGWSRQQAIDYMAEHTALAAHNIRAEVDRYISWPGQALAYKIGELKIRQLRELAEERLGARFDIRAFHDAVLRGGAVPLDVLEAQIQQYIESVRRASAAAP